MELVWDEVYENQRWVLRKGWKGCPQIRIDPSGWTNSSYQNMQSPYDTRLPESENHNLRWVWVDEWTQQNWKYAISFGATFGKFAFSEKRSKKHFVRQRKWRRPRIRKIEIGTTEIKEQVIENQRIMIKTWRSPYLPGDRPHYSDKNGHPLTMKQVESRLPPSWIWLQSEWKTETGEHTDKDGWEYSVDVHVGAWTPTFKQFVHNVRRKKWYRTRKLSGLIKETKKLEVFPSNKRSKSYSKSKSFSPSNDSNIKQIVIDEDDIDVDDGWDDDDDSFVTGSKFARFGNAQSGLPPNPPFQIGVCWKYDKIFRQTKNVTDTKSVTLAIWKPKINNIKTQNMNDEKKEDDDDDDDEEEKESQVYILGYLALSHTTDPNDNIPILTVKTGSDPDALKPPKNFELIHREKARRKSPKNNKDIDVYRYWLSLIPDDGYIALGSIVIEKYRDPIDENVFDHLKEYFYSEQQRKFLELYSLDKLMCIDRKYIDKFGQPLVEKLLTSKKSQFILRRPQPLIISGIYKLVEMACIIRKTGSESSNNDDTMLEFTDNIDTDDKKEHYSSCISQSIMDLCIGLLQHEIRIVVDTPLIISYATHFKLSWCSKHITSTSATKSAVWEPILGSDEFMVGHIAFGDWQHPSSHNNNYKLLIIKSGGSDPDAFKEPLGFECIWSVYRPGQRHKLGKDKGIGGGLLLSKVGSTVGLVDDESPKSGSFWRAIPPQGYTALGDIALPIDGEVSSNLNDDINSNDKISINQLLRSHDVPKYVCIKNEYLASFRTLEVDDINSMIDRKGSLLQSQILENKVRNRIWHSERCKDLQFHVGIYEQEPVTRDILSPMFCKGGKSKPISSELFPTLNIEFVIEAQPFWNVIKAGILRKKGEGFYAKSHKRYFVLTNEKLIYYYDDIEIKGKINLNKMRSCDITTDKEFYIDTPDRKWELEVVDENIKSNEWVQAIRSAICNDIDDDDKLFDDDITASQSQQNKGIVIEEKESEQEKIVKLLTKMLKRYQDLLKNTKDENETTESVESAVKWYSDLENTRCAIDILLAKWPRGTVCPPGVVRARAHLKDLMEESLIVILDDIKAYSNENMSPYTILRLHKACCLMSDLDRGQMMVSQYITEKLLKNSSIVFSAGNKDSDLSHIDRRFNEYRRSMKEYDAKYMSFIPSWWNLPIQIASRFCSLMGETLDDQLTRFPESHDAISDAKKKCEIFEQELIDDAMRRMAMIEMDIRSFSKYNKGSPISYIKIDDEDIMIKKGGGLCVVAIDLFTKKILKKRLFPMHKYHYKKKSVQSKKLLKEWLLFLNDIDEQTLIIMCIHESGGHNQFKKQLKIQERLPKELKALNITENDMISEYNLYDNLSPFIYIGRKGRKDTYFTLLNKKYKKGSDSIMARQIISPYIPKNRLLKLVDIQSIPFYKGIVSQVLERHLDIFVGEEAKNVQKLLGNVYNQETLIKLEENKNWLSTINKLPITSTSSAHFDSILQIDKTMKLSITACMKISNGKPLLDLLRKYGQILQEYASILLKLINESGGNKLKNKLNTTDNKSLIELKDEIKDNDDNIESTQRKRGLSTIFNIHSNNPNIWNTEEIQFFIIYCCLMYNTSNKARDLLSELIKIGKNDLTKKYQNGCKNDLIETKELFLSMEEQCLQLIRAAVMDKFESIFQFEKHENWSLDQYKKELIITFDLYLSNCSKLLTPSSLEHFYKVFVAHFALKLFDKILHSKTLNDGENSNILIDFPPIFESVVLKKITNTRIIKKMQIYMNRCLNPVIKLIQLAFANAGDKYSELGIVKTMKTNTDNTSDHKNIFSKFFGGGKKQKNINNDNDDNKENIDTSIQMKTREKTEIYKTVFANKSIQFYIDNNISLQILNNVPLYKAIFADDDDDEILIINDNAAESIAKAIDQTLIKLNETKKDIIIDNNNNPDIDNDSDSSLPDIDIADNDYFGNEAESTKIKKSSSGFAVKKTKKHKKRNVPKMAPPSIPSKPPISTSISAPPPNTNTNTNSNKATIGMGIGLSAMSLIVKKEIKLNYKWNVIERIMALRGFDVADQQTIRILCEDAQNNME